MRLKSIAEKVAERILEFDFIESRTVAVVMTTDHYREILQKSPSLKQFGTAACTGGELNGLCKAVLRAAILPDIKARRKATP